MRKAEIKDDDIVAAGERLLADGRDVNGWSLRVACGGGKPQRLAEVWERHLQGHRPTAEAAPAAVALPPKLEEQRAAMTGQMEAFIGGLVAATWRTAEDIANRRTEDERQQARETIARAETELSIASGELDKLEAQVGELTDQVEVVDGELERARTEITKLIERLTGVEEAAKQEAARAASTIAGLSEQLRQAHADGAEAKRLAAASDAAAVAADREADRLRGERNAVRAEADRLRADLDGVRRELQDAQVAGVQVRAEAARAAELGARSEERVRELTGELQQARAEAASAVDKLRAELSATLAKLADEARQRGEAEGRVGALGDQLGQVQARIAAVEGELTEARKSSSP